MLAFVLGAKLHLPLVQAAGWMNMTANYARIMPLEDAVATAVSGRELCGVCEYVRNAEHARQATDALFAHAASADILAPMPDDASLAPRFAEEPPAAPVAPSDLFAEARKELPETPPPRAAV